MKRLAGLLLSLAVSAGAGPRPDAAEAKTLFFDRHYAEARSAWAAVQAAGGHEAAVYWVARCSELLGEHERAFAEYERYLAARPRDGVLAEEARTSRVGLAVRLYRAGRKQHLPAAVDALADPSRTVRYFAALQLASLGAPAGRPAVPVLRHIVVGERDPDLVERARLGLLRLDPRALPSGAEANRPPGTGRWIKVRVHERGEAKVAASFPLALAELVFKSLPDDARQELKSRGYESESFLRQLQELGPTRLVDITSGDGERVEIWIE